MPQTYKQKLVYFKWGPTGQHGEQIRSHKYETEQTAVLVWSTAQSIHAFRIKFFKDFLCQ